MAEDLTDFFLQEGIRVRYLHSEIKSMERVASEMGSVLGNVEEVRDMEDFKGSFTIEIIINR